MTPSIANTEYELVPVDQLQPHPDNPRDGDVGAVAASIEQNGGFWGALVVQKSTGHILAGNHRYLAAKALGMDQLPVTWIECDDETAKRVLLADNRTSDIGTYDNQALADLLVELAGTEQGLDGLGYDGDDLDTLLADLGREQEDDTGTLQDPEPGLPDEAQERWQVQTGDVWKLGDQRLTCGDSTLVDTFARVMLKDELANAIWTDPPYGVDNAGSKRYLSEQLGDKRNIDALDGDTMSPGELYELLHGALGNALNVTHPGGAVYVSSPTGPMLMPFMQFVVERKVLRQCLVWAKDQMVIGRSDYHTQHEMILYGWKPGAAHQWYGDRKQATVFNHPRRQQREHHPTSKPVELVAYYLRQSTQKGDVVLDPFNGGGSTLLAAHQLGRRGRGIELDPRYAASTLERFDQLGVQPKRLVKGDT